MSKKSLQDKVAIITGGGSGFGEGTAKLYASEGAKIVVVDLNGDAANRVAEEIKQSGGDARGIKADVTKKADVAAFAKLALDAFGRIDILVNNAGYTHRNQPMLDVSEEQFDRVFDVNVKAIFLAAKEVIPVFRAQGTGGCIINTASTAGLRPRPGLVWYNSSKGAVITMTKSMAVELAPEKIRVNAICPVAGETGMLADFMGQDTAEIRAKFVASVPLGRLSLPQDIAESALYLATQTFTTGVALEIDGGRCI
ncbi:short-chain dehydrogenase/reductase SDR [Gonapodya prolifera JEL478]|uniref:Short-chain dehydrogenase/reductase SDR n=1 Tax=Gonapodya prolifera (strain JEL478) TaxID=1344416 RepID=A0A139AZJ0_GONPJ|nr:short-chain dehydrogenase/reductase SDR [Gonapodya prolifera JEL478]|eukprot:KXS21983.1 short-chain dehydrogenase/reductase SDR [Gonapodya prolifera JEL478]